MATILPSREYNHLFKNVSGLEKHFLNYSKRTDGNYSLSERMQCRAFIAFAHAEIEYYLESMATKILNKAEIKWNKSKRASKIIPALLAYRITKGYGLPKNPREQAKKSKLQSLVKKAISTHRHSIKSNHGIKPENISMMFLPLGMSPEDIEETLTIQLGNLGAKRGDLVHSSSQISLPKVSDPFDDELKDVNYLVEELKTFDKMASALV